jgi:hypothetical protein
MWTYHQIAVITRVGNGVDSTRPQVIDAQANSQGAMITEQGGPPRPREHGCAAKQAAAVELLAAARQRFEAEDTADSRRDLQTAVDAARDVGVGWTRIGDTLGIASGNAYQRYRKRPSRSVDGSDSPTPKFPDDEACG